MPRAIRFAEPRDLLRLEELENEADTRFLERFHPETWRPAPSAEERAIETGFILVAAETLDSDAIGFVHVVLTDKLAHLQQLSVLPSHARRGLGRALVEAAKSEAFLRGFKTITLRTFAEVPWNAPFYSDCGFVEAQPDTQFHLERGYASTTVAAVAAASGVSAETVYKAFGGKPGIVRAIFERSLLGSGPGPAEMRSDADQLASPDPRALFRRLGTLSAEVAPLTAPIMRLIRDAAAGGDTAMSTLLHDVERKRYERMLHNAEVLEQRGFLRAEITAALAADVMWLYTADDVFNSLVVSRRWPLKVYGEFIADALSAALSVVV